MQAYITEIVMVLDQKRKKEIGLMSSFIQSNIIDGLPPNQRYSY